MYRYFTTNNTLNFLLELQALVKSYNRSYHRSIKMAPNQVTEANSPKVWNALYGKTITKPKKPRLKVGDRVRLKKKFRPFKKSTSWINSRVQARRMGWKTPKRHVL